MPSSTQARWLAPVALAGALVAVIIVISAGGAGDSGGGAGVATTTGAHGGSTTQPSPTTSTTTTAPRTGAKTYIVKPGDVLSAIAEKTGVPLSEIEQLNPDVDAQSLHAGQKLKLAPSS
jgi:LysM repeat protein